MRRNYVAGAVVAAVVTVVFATAGDGVDAPETSGLRRVVIDHGHTATWAALALALGLAATRGRWQRLSQSLALLGGGLYAAFLLALFTRGQSS